VSSLFTSELIWITLSNALALIFAESVRKRFPILGHLWLGFAMAPLYLAISKINLAMPRANKPPDDGMYSIAGAGLRAVEEANAEQADWKAVAFYSSYACIVLAGWFAVFHYYNPR
jgi:hypothetical protein